MAKVMLYSMTLDADFAGRAPGRPGTRPFAGAYRLFRQSAQADPFGQHTLTDDIDAADLVVFTDPGGEGLFSEWVRHHPWFRRHREKCFIFDTGDQSLPLVPGLYASLHRHHHQDGRTRTGHYPRTDEHPAIDQLADPARCERLGAFIGALDKHPLRLALARHASDRLWIEDMSDFAARGLRASPEGIESKEDFWGRYAAVMASAAFALCPRGKGPGSVRLFEAMRMGRCPVIISDDWVEPERIDWASCSLRVHTSRLPDLERILEDERHRASVLGQNARRAWERYYAPQVRFHWLVEDCLSILAHRRWPEAIAGRLAWRHLLDRQQLRLFVASKMRIYLLTHRLVL